MPAPGTRAATSRHADRAAAAAASCSCASCELQVVELLDHARVVRVGEQVRRLRHQRDRARDAVRLVLRLLEHALDLTADALRDRPVQRRARRAGGSRR